MRVKHFSKGIVLALIFTFIVGYTSEVLTLEEALEEAMRSNPTILAADAQVDAASARVLPAFLWPDPSFEVMWMNIPPGSLDPADAGMTQYSVSQMIAFPGKTLARGTAMAAKQDMVEAQSDATVSRTLADVEYAYWTVYRLSRDRDILNESLVLLGQLLASARSRYATGAAPQAEVLRAQLARSEVEVKLVSLEEKLGASKIELALLLGRESADLPTLPEDIPIEFAVTEFPSTETAPMVQMSEAKVRASNRQLTGAWLDLMPDFMAAYRWREANGEMGSGDIMVGITLPIWVWPKGSNRIIAASAERKVTIYQNQATSNQVETMYAKLTAKLTASRAEIERIQHEVLPLAEQALASSRLAYETGAVEFNTLLEVERSWRSARMSLEASRFEYQTSLADLRALLGGYEIKRETR